MNLLQISVLVGFITILILTQIRDYKKSPKCKWCGARHYGRCIFNPRSGRIFNNRNDGYYNYNDPNV